MLRYTVEGEVHRAALDCRGVKDGFRVVDFCKELRPPEGVSAGLDEVDELVGEKGDSCVGPRFTLPLVGTTTRGFGIRHVFDQGFFGAVRRGKRD